MTVNKLTWDVNFEFLKISRVYIQTNSQCDPKVPRDCVPASRR